MDQLEIDPGMKLKVMAEIRGQLRLQFEIFRTFIISERLKNSSKKF